MKDISAGGLYVKLAQEVETDAALASEVALCPERLAVSESVTRVELLIDGRRGVTIAFDRHSSSQLKDPPEARTVPSAGKQWHKLSPTSSPPPKRRKDCPR